MIKKIVTSLCVAGLTACILMTSFAADISKVTIDNYNTSNVAIQQEIAAGIEVLPDSVADYFTATGGKVVLHDGILHFNNDADDIYVMGLYFNNSNRIQIRTTEDLINNPNVSIKGTVVHEFGHFLYDEVVPYLSTEDKNIITNMYNYWSKYMLTCTNENETFAEQYKKLKVYGDNTLNVEEITMYEHAEELCTKPLNYYNEHGRKLEMGPGVNINDLLEYTPSLN